MPSARGTLAKTPLAHALVYVRNKKLTGRFELRAPDGREASVAFHRGRIAGAVTSPPAAYFGSLAYELGFIDAPTLDATLGELAKRQSGRPLHGEILVDRGALTPAQRNAVLVEQMCRKVHSLFDLPDETEYAFHDDQPTAADPPVLVDPLAPAWRGVREHPPAASIADVLHRIGATPLCLVAEDGVDRARLGPEETALAKSMAELPKTIDELRASTTLSSTDVDRLVYVLVLAKCIEPLSGVRAVPSIGPMPPKAASTAPPPPVRSSTPAPQKSGFVPAYRPSSSPSSSSLPPPPSIPPASMPPRAVATPADIGAEGLALRAPTVESEDLFEILGVDRRATTDAIRDAYFRIARTWHPERLSPELAASRAHVARIFAHMTHAQQTLCDPAAKKRWLAERRVLLQGSAREDALHAIEKALERRDFAEAERASRELADADPDDVDALALLAWSTARAGEAPETIVKTALAMLDRAVQADRTNERALYLRGCIWKKLGKPDAAYRDFVRVAHQNPRHVDALREIRLHEMRARKSSAEHGIDGLIEKLRGKK